MITIFNLSDPLTSVRFPTPLPRSSFLSEPDNLAQHAYHAWRKMATAGVPKARLAQSQDGACGPLGMPNPSTTPEATSPTTQPASPAADHQDEG